MNAHIVFGLFALYVAITSLYMVLTGHQDAVLEALRRVWGRTLGHSLYFVARVAVPVLICVFCLGWGVRTYDASRVVSYSEARFHLNIEAYRDLMESWRTESGSDPFDVVYGA